MSFYSTSGIGLEAEKEKIMDILGKFVYYGVPDFTLDRLLKNGQVTINEDLSVEIDNQVSVMLYQIQSDNLGINIVSSGDIQIENCNFKSLRGIPKHIFGSLSIKNCPNIKTLHGEVEYVQGNYSIVDVGLISLIGGPEFVGGDYVINNTMITSLKGVPKCLFGTFECCKNSYLVDIEDAPLIANEINSDIGLPKTIKNKHPKESCTTISEGTRMVWASGDSYYNSTSGGTNSNWDAFGNYSDSTGGMHNYPYHQKF